LSHLQLYTSKEIVPTFVEVDCMKLEQKDFGSLQVPFQATVRLAKEQKEQSLNTPIGKSHLR
jgi:hypothetical protein